VMFCQRKNKKPWPLNTREKGSWLLLVMGHMQKGCKNPIIKLIFLWRILTQFSYEEYNDTKHPTTQSNDLVTSPCQLWNLKCILVVVSWSSIRHDWEWAYKTCIVLAQRWLAHTLLVKWFFISATQRNWGSKWKNCMHRGSQYISPNTLPWHAIS
jgi:hypothetical protein